MRKNGFTINDVLWDGLRNCQQESVSTALSYLSKPVSNKSCLISLPTGAGKSGVICTLSHVAKNRRILILCHRRAVCDQLKDQLAGVFFSLVAPNVDLPSKDVFSKVDDSESDGVYITTFQKLHGMEPEALQKLKDNVDLLIIDEGHSEPSPVWSQIARDIGAHKIIITATPYRNDLFQFDIDPKVSYIYTFKKALADNVLVDPEFESTNSDELTSRVSTLLKKYPNSKCIVKCNKIEDIEIYLELFSKKFNALAIHERFVNDRRDNVKSSVPKKISETDWDVIIHQRKLDEGVDIPQARILVLTYPVASGRELVQTVGRVVRFCNNYGSHVIEVMGESNQQVWENYREFDLYITDNTSAKKFLRSLDTAGLIDSYLDAFPDVSYFQSGYRKKFNLKEFQPSRSLVIPLASVCFIKKAARFSLQAMTDRLYWNFTRDGELVELRTDQYGADILLSICFDNSKFLKDELFFQPSLEVILVKELDGLVAVYDSRSRNFSHEKELCLGAAIDIDDLLTLATRAARTRTKEAHTRAISSTTTRAEGISIKGEDLERTMSPQGNSSYALTTLKVDNMDSADRKHSSYYLGVGSGRVSDQKKRNFTLEQLCSWIDDVNTTIQGGIRSNSQLINSYAKPVKEKPRLEPLSILVDLSDLPSEIFTLKDGNISSIDNGFVLMDFDEGVAPLVNSPEFKLRLELDEKENKLVFRDEDNLSYAYDQQDLHSLNHQGKIVDLLNNTTFKVLYPNGMSYFDGEFYQVILPSQRGMSIDEDRLGGAIIGLETLLNCNLSEKDDAHVRLDSFGRNSMFFLLDQLKNTHDDSATRDQFGPFYNYLPDADLVLCTDMGTEPADFIISSPNKLVYAHVKCRSAQRPQSSAGSIAEVGGQAIKNLEMLISSNETLRPANRAHLLNTWSTRLTGTSFLQERIRLFQGSRFLNPEGDSNARLERLNEVWSVISSRRTSSAVQKEIWIIVGNGFSRQHFVDQMNRGHQAVPETLQAYQLIDSWMATCASIDVSLKFFVSP